MALFSGKKHWTFFPREHTSFLYPEYEHSLDPSFQVSSSLFKKEKKGGFCAGA